MWAKFAPVAAFLAQEGLRQVLYASSQASSCPLVRVDSVPLECPACVCPEVTCPLANLSCPSVGGLERNLGELTEELRAALGVAPVASHLAAAGSTLAGTLGLQWLINGVGCCSSRRWRRRQGRGVLEVA